jgi:hypothetical protein
MTVWALLLTGHQDQVGLLLTHYELQASVGHYCVVLHFYCKYTSWK